MATKKAKAAAVDIEAGQTSVAAAPKEPKKKPKDNDRFDEVMNSDLVQKMKKKFGMSIVNPASRFEDTPLRLTTGAFFVDYGLGGGWPMGRWNTVYGEKSSGKTALCLKTIASAQQSCANCWCEAPNGKCTGCGKYRMPVVGYIDVEGTWDSTWAKTLGIDIDRLLLSQPEFQEQTLDIAEALLRSESTDLLVIDSLAFLTPQKEIEESTGKALQAEQARVLGRGVRKIVAAQNYVGNKIGRRPTILCTNQMRMKIGVMFGDPHVTPGGKAPGFAATTEVKCWSGAKADYLVDEVTGKTVYVDLHFKVEKNKSSASNFTGVWRLMTASTELKKKGDLYDEPAIVEKAVTCGFVVQHSTQRLECLGENFRAKSLIAQRMMEDPNFNHAFRVGLLSSLQ